MRPQFQPGDTGASRMALGLDAQRPVLLVTGGSQGASGVNDLVLAALPALAASLPDLQYLHLTGPTDLEKVQAAYAAHRLRAVVRPFLSEMELALGAATVAVSRAGGASLAEIATLRVPAVLIPYPIATDNHQFHNAKAFVDSGAACLLEQRAATGDQLAALVQRLVTNPDVRTAMIQALERWDVPQAAERIAEQIVTTVEALSRGRWTRPDSGHPTSVRRGEDLENRAEQALGAPFAI